MPSQDTVLSHQVVAVSTDAEPKGWPGNLPPAEA